MGGTGTHAVISAHSGTAYSRMFTDLDKLQIGDFFSLQILGETLTYQVDQILTVLPSEIEALEIDPQADYVTLITCTPYGINSHRLLVRGRRVTAAEQETEATVPEESRPAADVRASTWTEKYWQGILLGLVLAAALLGCAALAVIILKKRRRDHEKK